MKVVFGNVEALSFSHSLSQSLRLQLSPTLWTSHSNPLPLWKHNFHCSINADQLRKNNWIKCAPTKTNGGTFSIALCIYRRMAERQLDPAVVPPFLAAFVVQWKMCLHNLLTALLLAAILRQLGRALHRFSVSRTRLLRYLLSLGGANLWNAKAGVIVRFSLCSCSSCVSPAASTLDKASKAPPARHKRPRQPAANTSHDAGLTLL